MIQWMDYQMKSCQQPPRGRQAWVRKEADITLKGEWTHLVGESTCNDSNFQLRFKNKI
jgi:hypothetical protein